MSIVKLAFSTIQDPPKPAWLKIRPPSTEKFESIKNTLQETGLHTVCQSAHCPNQTECWSGGTATFMVLGNICTRGCRFCSVPKGVKGEELDLLEPLKLANSVEKWGLSYVVITSVDRDDLPDEGSNHFANCIRALADRTPSVFCEVLIPDFKGNPALISNIVNAKPKVIAHNLETTKDLQSSVRDPRANYEQSLRVLKIVKELDPSIYTKSALMLGLGETPQMVEMAFDDLRAVGCDFLTLGQYLRPSLKHLPVSKFITPEEFENYRQIALKKGFKYVAAGPFVRSSYKAGEFFIKSIVEKPSTSVA